MGPEDKRDDQENLLCVKVERMDYYRGWNQPAVDTISDAVIQFNRPNVTLDLMDLPFFLLLILEEV